MKFSILGVLALLSCSALAVDPKVQPLKAADAEEAANAQVEEPRDKRDWISVDEFGNVNAYVESDLNPALVAQTIAHAETVGAGSFVNQGSPSVSGRTRIQPSGSTQFNQFSSFNPYRQYNPYSHYNPSLYYGSGTQGRTGSLGALGSNAFPQHQFQQNFASFENFNQFNELRRQSGLSPVPWGAYTQGNFGFGQRHQNLPDVIDTSPQGRTRVTTSASGQHISVYAPHDVNNRQWQNYPGFNNYNPGFNNFRNFN